MDLALASLTQLSIHLVGNSSQEQALQLFETPITITEALSQRLEPFFLSKFPTVFERLQFSHSSSLDFNEVYQYARQVFSSQLSLHDASKEIATHLYDVAVHPNIKGGELYIALFDHCVVQNKSTQAIGIFKTEVRSGYFDMEVEGNQLAIHYHEGIDVKKFDKGCLIFNIDEKTGYEVYVIDNQNRGEEAHFWKESFLGLKPIQDEFQQTNQFLGLTKSFVTEQFPQEFNINKSDQIDLLNRSVDYFKGRETFDKRDFEQEVLQDKGVIDSFRQFGNEYVAQHDIELEDSFDINHQAVKKQSRVFKSVLKLDKNFHVYIHGDKNLIEHGVETDGRKFYKIYYEEES